MFRHFMFGGLPGLFLDLALQRTFTLLTSPVLLDELDEKLRGKFEVKLEDAALIRRKLKSIAELVEPAFVLNVIRSDPDDNRVVECAVAGNADFVVTGDRHLLQLGSYEGTAIVTVRKFMEFAPLRPAGLQ
jgi:putative PIN family toxin of toxin-antitoxin system